MDTLCHGLSFCNPSQSLHNPSQSLQYTTTTNMFINDASNCANDFLSWLHQTPALHDVVDMLQQDSQTWERLHWTSGGLLNLSKWLYYILAWCFDSEGRATMVPATDIHPSLRLTSGNDPNRAAINHFNYETAHTYLGDSLAPNLQMRTGDAALMKTGLNFSRRLVSSSLSKHDVWIAYFAVFQPAMTYTFPVLFLGHPFEKENTFATRIPVLEPTCKSRP
jgi:hypothetical protein